MCGMPGLVKEERCGGWFRFIAVCVWECCIAYALRNRQSLNFIQVQCHMTWPIQPTHNAI